jgi:hypothetical protein
MPIIEERDRKESNEEEKKLLEGVSIFIIIFMILKAKKVSWNWQNRM